MRQALDPNDFIDADEAFPDDYNPEDGITHASFTIVPGGEVNHAELVYWADGISFLGGSTGTNWAIGLYQGHHYNGQDLPISEDAARHVLETLCGDRDIEGFDWAAHDWVYVE